MTLTVFLSLLAQHWVLLALVLCPIIVVVMALAALTCEACGAPFGIFRRRSKTIDLCLRCAVLHDIRRAKDERDGTSGAVRQVRDETPSEVAELEQKRSDASEPQDRRGDRRYSAPPGALGVADPAGIR
jgi:hypothetical protein